MGIGNGFKTKLTDRPAQINEVRAQGKGRLSFSITGCTQGKGRLSFSRFPFQASTTAVYVETRLNFKKKSDFF
eukprot:COSAG03_NODE_3244_length_2125_cov_15.067127_2_plen_73_part_00